MVIDARNHDVGRVSMHRESSAETCIYHGASLIHFYRSENAVFSHYVYQPVKMQTKVNRFQPKIPFSTNNRSHIISSRQTFCAGCFDRRMECVSLTGFMMLPLLPSPRHTLLQ